MSNQVVNVSESIWMFADTRLGNTIEVFYNQDTGYLKVDVIKGQFNRHRVVEVDFNEGAL